MDKIKKNNRIFTVIGIFSLILVSVQSVDALSFVVDGYNYVEDTPIHIENNNKNLNYTSTNNTSETVMLNGSIGVDAIAYKNLQEYRQNDALSQDRQVVVNNKIDITIVQKDSPNDCSNCYNEDKYLNNNYRKNQNSNNYQSDYDLVYTKPCGETVSVNKLASRNSVASDGSVAYALKQPTCSLVPALSKAGAIELQWQTINATVAFIDNGIGHIKLGNGSRVITPHTDMIYNLTVINDAGVSSACTARVVVQGGKQSAAVNTAIAGSANTIKTENTTQTIQSNQNDQLNNTVKPIQKNTINKNQNIEASQSDNSIVSATTSKKVSLFGPAFWKVAMPIAIVFLILIVLLVILMSKIKAAK
jgi:hypothetical protein